jgi:hypothetical protein
MYDKVMVAWSLSSQRLIVTDICKYAYLHACPFSENHTGECVVSVAGLPIACICNTQALAHALQ